MGDAVSEETQYPQGYRRCRTCGAYIGAPCTSRYAAIIMGRPEGGPVELPVPHPSRKVRAGW